IAAPERYPRVPLPDWNRHPGRYRSNVCVAQHANPPVARSQLLLPSRLAEPKRASLFAYGLQGRGTRRAYRREPRSLESLSPIPNRHTDLGWRSRFAKTGALWAPDRSAGADFRLR